MADERHHVTLAGRTPATHTTEPWPAEVPGQSGFGSVLAVPVEPPPSRWALPTVASRGWAEAPRSRASAPIWLRARCWRRTAQGLFPMRLQARGPIGLGPIGWWSPDPRGIIPLDGLHVSRSLRRSVRRFEIRVDTAFEAGDARVRRSAATARLDRQEVHRRVHRAPPTRVGAQRGDVAGRRAADERARRWSVRRRASAACSRPSRSSIASPTRRRSRWSRSSTSCARVAAPCSTCSGRRRTWRRSARSTCRVRATCELVAEAVPRPPISTFPDHGRAVASAHD